MHIFKQHADLVFSTVQSARFAFRVIYHFDSIIHRFNFCLLTLFLISSHLMSFFSVF